MKEAVPAVRPDQINWKTESAHINALLRDTALTEARERATELAQRAPKAARPYFWLTNIALRENDLPAARAALAESLKREVNERFQTPLQIKIALAEGDDRLAVDLTLAHAGGKGLPTGDLGRMIFHAANRLGDWDTAEKICDAMLELKPDDRRWLMEKYTAFCNALQGRAEPGALHQRIFGPSGGPEHLIGLTYYARTVDTTDPVIEDLAQLAQDTWPDAPQTRAMRQDLDDLQDIRNRPIVATGPELHLRPGQSPDPQPRLIIEGIKGKPVQVSPVRPSDAVLLAFLPSPTAIRTFDGFAAALGVTAIYVLDPTGCYMTGGLATFGVGYDASVAGFKRLLAELKPGGRLIILGGSGGNLGAINFASDLPTDRLIVMGPVTCVDPDFQASIGDPRRPATLEKITRRIPRSHRFPVERLAKSPPKQTIVAYSEHNLLDEAHANQLRDIPNTRFEILRGTDTHLITTHMINEGRFLDFFQHAIGGDEK